MISLCILWLLSPVLGVSIDRVQVPPVVEEGEESVILDCPFSFNYDEEENLELKWYFNDSPSPFYQWLPGTRGAEEVSEPQVIGEMWRQKTDLNWTKYEDGARRHRAVLLSRPSVHMSGLYRYCTHVHRQCSHVRPVQVQGVLPDQRGRGPGQDARLLPGG